MVEKIAVTALFAVLGTAVSTWLDVRDLKREVQLMQQDLAKRSSPKG